MWNFIGNAASARPVGSFVGGGLGCGEGKGSIAARGAVWRRIGPFGITGKIF